MSDLTVTHSIPTTIVVLSQDALDQIDRLTHEACALKPTDAASLANCDLANKRIAALQSQITEGRLALTRPLDDLKKQAMAAERQGTEPLEAARVALSGRIQAFVAAERARVAEAERLAREERDRLQREEFARAEAERARMQAEADARAELEAPPGEEPAKVEVPITAALPVSVPLRQVAAPLVSASVRKATEYSVQITDESLIPTTWAGTMVRPVDQAALKRLLKGMTAAARDAFPGARLVEVASFARKG